MSIEKKIEKSLEKLHHVNHWIANCDTKSSFLLTFYGVVITIIFTSDMLVDMKKTLSLKKASEISLESIRLFFALTFLIIFFLSIAVTLVYLFITLRGRINPTIFKEKGLKPESLFFFGNISKKKFFEFERASDTEQETSYLNDINSQIYINSKIATKKFNNYNRSLMWLTVSFGSFLIYLAFK